MGTLIFLILTFGVTWALWLACSGREGLLAMGGPVFLLGVVAPGLVALALTWRSEGRAGVIALLGRIGRWKVAPRWYVFAIGYLAAAKLTAAVIHRAATGAWPAFGDTAVGLMLAGILVSTWMQAGEEIGWRGYALPRLARHLGLGPASILLGIIWGAWHLPLFLLPDAGSTGQSFPLYLLHVTALSVAMAWLYWRTGGSLLLVMIMHAAINNTTGMVPAAVPGASNPFTFSGSFVGWATVAVSWAIAAVLLVQMPKAPAANGDTQL